MGSHASYDTKVDHFGNAGIPLLISPPASPQSLALSSSFAYGADYRVGSLEFILGTK